VFRKYVEKIQVPLKSDETRITGALLEGHCIFLIISRSFLLMMRNVSDQSCRENQNTHAILDTCF